MSLLSIICVYNSKSVLDECLISGLQTQNNKDYELILIDNRKNEFSSAASALNYGAKKAKGERLIFTHQDIKMLDCDTLSKINTFFDQGLEIFGSSGVKKYSAKMVSNVYTTNFDEAFYANKLCKRITSPEIVETLDECFVCMTREVFNKVGGFDEKVCDNWHMYCVDLTISAKEKGIKVYSVPLNLFHQSTGTISKSFIFSLKKVCKKHHLIWMAAPCYHFFAFAPFMWALYYFWQINYKLKKNRP
ncbi:MAG: glycosyltransferase [Spirochaetales bacterium]|nr:glycosyltransferase [Spirochaetales bacterium]